jgi:hypothetical protein
MFLGKINPFGAATLQVIWPGKRRAEPTPLRDRSPPDVMASIQDSIEAADECRFASGIRPTTLRMERGRSAHDSIS